MKKITITFIFAIAIAYSFAQNKLYKGNNLLIPANYVTEYAVPLYPWESLELIMAENEIIDSIFNIILTAAMKPEVNVYDTVYTNPYYIFENRKILDKDAVETNLGTTSYTEERLDTVTNKWMTHLIKNKYNEAELFGINFIEDWTLTENPFAMTKNVIGYIPIRKIDKQKGDEKEFQYKNTFLVLDTIENKKEIERSDARMILTNKIKYVYFLYNDNLPNSRHAGYFEFYNKRTNNSPFYKTPTSPVCNEFMNVQFIKSIVDKILAGELKAYSYKNKEMDRTEIYDILGGGIDVKQFDDEIHEHIAPFDLTEIRSIIFNEEWYIDPITLRMKKKVISITPIRWYFRNTDIDKQVTLSKRVFTVYFDNEK